MIGFDSVKGAASVAADKAKAYAKEGFEATKGYAKKGAEFVKDYGLKAGEKLKPLANDAVTFVKANPGKTAAIAVAGFAVGTVLAKLVGALFHKTPEK